MNFKIIIVIFLVIAIILLWTIEHNIESYIETLSTVDYYPLVFSSKEAKTNFHLVHDYILPTLKEYSYYTFDGRFKNISKDTFFPSNLTDIKDIVTNAKHRKIRASGGHHTFNDISLSPDITMRFLKLKEILNVDKANKLVTVQSGITLDELNIYLRDNLKLSLPVLPAVAFQSLGGALSTSSHGSRKNFGSMASMIHDMTLVLFNGAVKKFDKNSPEFGAIATNLGCLGVIYSVTIKCEDLFLVEHTEKEVGLSEALEKLDELQDEYIFLQLYVYPLLKTNSGDIMCVFYLRKKVAFDLRLITTDKYATKRIDYSHKILTHNVEVGDYSEEEIAVPREALRSAILNVVKLQQDYDKKHGFKTGYPILVRFTGPDNSLLSMTEGRNSAFLDTFIPATRATEPLTNSYFNEYEEMLINKYGGRPHYGKRNNLTYDKMIKLYGKNVDKFNKIRKTLDPIGMFTNDYIKRLLDQT